MLKYIIFLVSDEYYDFLMSTGEKLQQNIAGTGTCCIIEKELQKIDKELFKDPAKSGVLFVCDEPVMAGELYQKGFPVMAVYHEGNKGASFGNLQYAAENPEELDFSAYEEAYRRICGLPLLILETEHLLVRESTVEDVDAFYRIYADPDVSKYLEELFKDPNEERAYMKSYIKQFYGFYGFGMWTVILKETGQVIGRAGLSVREGYELPELGFVIERAYQGRGLGFEVCKAILAYAGEVLAFDKLQALVEEENKVSLGLLEKLGFQKREKVTIKKKEYLLMIAE